MGHRDFLTLLITESQECVHHRALGEGILLLMWLSPVCLQSPWSRTSFILWFGEMPPVLGTLSRDLINN